MFEQKVLKFCQQHNLIKKNARVLIGVSGGPDSIALLHFLLSVAEQYELKIVVAHVDHMFRGDESYEDLLFVEKYCNEQNVTIETRRINVPEYIKQTGKSSQVAARDCRYKFYNEVMTKHQLDTLALGHHGDDQVETVLMRLTRGSTGSARAGIQAQRNFDSGTIIRPFLAVSKEEILNYCSVNNLTPREDISNSSNVYVRNRVRNEILPLLKRENNLVHEHFQRFSENILEDEQLLIELAKEKMNEVITSKKDFKTTINIKRFLQVAISLQKRIIQLILNYLYSGNTASLSSRHVEDILILLNKSHPSGTLHFPLGLHIIRSYNECTFQFSPSESKDYYFEIYEPGTILLPTGKEITMSLSDEVRNFNNLGNDSIILNRDEINFPIIIRTRRSGDRISIIGMNGKKKLKSIFIEEKVPLKDRNEWPVVTDGREEVLWIPNLRKSSKAINSTEQSNYIILTTK